MRTQFLKKSFITGVSSFALLATLMTPAQALVVRDDVTVEGSEEAADDPKWDGAIQLFSLLPDGRLFFNCSGSVINARTIISAAHCFNSNPSTAFGIGPGQITPVIAYGPDTFDAIFGGLNNDRNGFTFGTSVILHPDADPANGNFLDFPGADVALVSLQDPLTTIPSYSLLFSPVPVGTHVTQVAYGGHGIGSTGDVGIDGKRQIGENIIGLIGSQNDFIRGVFNAPDSAIFGNLEGEQSLYWIDFDNPERTGDECVRDQTFGDIICDEAEFFVSVGDVFLLPDTNIDYFPGDALPGEAGTAGGDSGSAIFVDELGADPLIAGVLSGGFGFTTPVSSGYGDVSYYNPLFNFYNFIAEFNPYKYVSANAGDGNWSDASHWVQDLDPGYFIIDANGNLVNGLPTGPEPGVRGTGPKEGIIFDNDINDVQPGAGPAGEGSPSIIATNNIATGEVGITANNLVANGEVPGLNGLITLPGKSNGLVAATKISGDKVSADLPDRSIDKVTHVDTFFNGEFDAPSLANGPGATGFIPNNSQLFLADGSFNTNFFAEYFDVTLRNAGTTFADIDFIEVDKLTIDNNDAKLVINEMTDFVSIIDTQIARGTLDVMGLFTSRDILNGGLITGTGEIFTETLFNVGMINAGEGFTINGDVIFTSVGVLAFSGNALNVNGNVSLDGGILLGFDGAPTFGQSGTLLNYTGQRTGIFADVSDLPGVLFANVDYSVDGKVTFDVQAGTFADFIDPNATPNQQAIAGLLDANRVNFSSLSDLFGAIDLLSGAALTTALDSLSPNNALNEISVGFARTETMSAQVGRRLSTVGSGGGRGVAQFTSNGHKSNGTRTLVAASGMGAFEASAEGHANNVALKDGWGLFGDLTYYTGTAQTTLAGVDAGVDGYSFTGGADFQFSDELTLGAYFNYGTGDMEHNGLLNTNDYSGVGVGAYANLNVSDNVTMNGYFGYGARDADLERLVVLGAQTQRITGKADARELMAGLEFALPFSSQDGKYKVTPSVRYDYADFDVDAYSETGGSAALNIARQENSSSQLSAGAKFNAIFDVGSSRVNPMLGARLIHDSSGGNATGIAATFVNAPGTIVNLAGTQRDSDWFEVETGIEFGISDTVSGQLQVAQTISRDDLDLTSVSARLNIRF